MKFIKNSILTECFHDNIPWMFLGDVDMGVSSDMKNQFKNYVENECLKSELVVTKQMSIPIL